MSTKGKQPGQPAPGAWGPINKIGVAAKGLLLAALGLFVCWKVAGMVHRDFRSVWAYQTATGSVTQYTPAGGEGLKKDPDIHPRIKYAYTVQGRTYEGDFSPTPGNGYPADAFGPDVLAPMTRGEPIEVHYDPLDPSQSTPDPFVNTVELAFAFMLAAMVFHGVRYLLPRLRRQRREDRSQDDEDDKDDKEVQEDQRPPLMPVFWKAHFVASFLCLFVGGLSAMWISWRAGLVVVPAIALLVPVAAGLVAMAVRVRIARLEPQYAEPAEAEDEQDRREEHERGEEEDQCSELRRRLEGWSPVTPMTVLVLTLVALFWCAGVGAFAGWACSTTWKQLDAQKRFAVTDGTVAQTELRQSHSSEDVSYEPIVIYRYRVGGQEYVGDRITFARATFRRETAARQLEAYPVGSKVNVHYDPDDPASSVLAVKVPPYVWAGGLALQPFLVVGLFLIYLAVKAFRVCRLQRRTMRVEAWAKRAFNVPPWEFYTLCPPKASTRFGRSATYGLPAYCVTAIVVGLALILADGADHVVPEHVIWGFCGAVAAGVIAGALAAMFAKAPRD